MPVNIYSLDQVSNSSIAVLCDESWSIVEQLYALEEWLIERGVELEACDYVADIGIAARTDFANGVGGGAAFSPEAMAIMAEKGIALHVSEYPV